MGTYLTAVGEYMMEKLSQLAYIIRSKNAGPFYITLDILFPDDKSYQRVKASGAITREAIAKLYRLPENEIDIYFYDNAAGIKITYPRHASAGDFYDTDCYGAQQHAPLLDILIP